MSGITNTIVTAYEYKEDTAHVSGDKGVFGLGVRKDTVAAVAADGDYTPILTSEMGAVWTEHIPNEVNAANSSTSTLLADAVFTGTGVDILTYDLITITLDSSHDSATDGMSFQFSTDNSNWDDVYPFTYTAADGARRFQFPITAQYFRVVYTNGGTGQTHFRLQTLLHHGNSLTSIHRLVDDTANDRSAQIVKAAIIAQKGGGGPGAGDFVPVQSTTAGNLKMSTQEISDGLDIGAGNAGAETQRVSISTDQATLPVKQVSGFSDSVQVNGFDSTVGATLIDADGAYRDVFPTQEVTVRDLTSTAYVSLSDGDETTLLAGTASTFYDLVYIMGANQSDAAVTIDVRCGTAGAIIQSLTIPAEATQGVSLSRPIPMVEQHQAWTVDMPDITGTTVDISALFDKV